MAVLATPVAAYAALQQYALNYPLAESTMKYSAPATVAGGRAQTTGTLPRVYIQTLSGGVLVASSYADGGGLANMSHASYAGAQSRCYWDWLPGSVPGTMPINCWRSY
jgi:hypothetical protein